MPTSQTIFSQLMDFIPAYEFRKCVQRYNGNYKVKSFSCWDQYPFRKMSEGTINTPTGDRAIFNWLDTNKTRPLKKPQLIEPSQSKPVKLPNVSAPAPNS